MFTRAAPPPPPHNTNNHCVSRRNHCVGQFLCKNLLENNFQGPHVYKGFPYNTTHITTVWAHTTTVWADETTVWVNSPVKTLLENNFQGSTFIKGSPYNIPHITTVCAHTITVYTTGKQLSGPHVYKGFPSIKNTHNHYVGTHNHCLPYWKTTLRTPCLPGPPPLFLLTTQTTTVRADETTVWVNSSVKTYWKSTFKDPIFIKGFPLWKTHIITVWAHTTTVYPTGKQLSGLRV